MIVKLLKKRLSRMDWRSRFFDRYAELLADHARLLIIGSVCLTCLLSLGFANLRVSNDLRFMYTPPNSPSLDEYQVHKQFQKDNGSSIFSYNVAVVGVADGQNVLTRWTADELRRLDRFLNENMTLGPERVRFGDMCDRQAICKFNNLPLLEMLETYFELDDEERRRTMRFPVAEIYGLPVFLGAYLYGVRTDQNDSIVSASMIHLTFFYPIDDDVDHRTVDAFETEMDAYVRRLGERSSPDTGLRYLTFSLNKLEREIAGNTVRTLPYLPLSVVALTVYTALMTVQFSDPVGSKPLEGFVGVLTTLLAILSAGGLLFVLPFNQTLVVVPFLTLALAVDDTYIGLSAWRHSGRSNDFRRRFRVTIACSVSTISLTMVTDVLAFLIGGFSNTPAISHFCLFLATAIAFDYLYQMTFFGAFLALAGRREEERRHCLFFWLPVNQAPFWKGGGCDYRSSDNNKSFPTVPTDGASIVVVGGGDENSDHVGGSIVEQLLRKRYAPLLLNGWFRLATMLLYAVLALFAFYGCVIIAPNLTPKKLLMNDSPLQDYIQQAETHVWRECLTAFVYVQNAPDLRDVGQRRRFMQFVQLLENGSHSLGPQSTELWLNDYEKFRRFLNGDSDYDDDDDDGGGDRILTGGNSSLEPDYYENLDGFLRLNDNERWLRYLRFANESDRSAGPSQFFFTSGFRLQGWTSLPGLIGSWRSICRQFPDYQAVVYEDNNFYADQIVSMAPSVVQDTGIAFFCIMVTCAFFIPQPILLFWVTWSLVSMNMGVIGFLAWWNCDLDPTAVTSILLSVGLTVDFTVHIAYHYYKTSSLSCQLLRLQETLSVGGWPLLQGGLSTLLSVLTLSLIPSYVIGVFFRTVFLVIVLGLLHGMLFMPVLMTSLHMPERRRMQQRR